MTIIIVIFAEVLPKTYAINRPMKSAIAVSGFLTFLIFILSPFVRIINFFINLILKNLTKKSQKLNEQQISKKKKRV